MVEPVFLRGMSLREAKAVLDAIGYDPAWSIEQLKAATPAEIIPRVVAALRITAAAAQAEAMRIENG